MSEPVDTAAGWIARQAYTVGVEHGREMERGPMQNEPELRARIRHLEADVDQCMTDSQVVNTYALALQVENEGLWRQLAAAQAAVALARAAHRVTREALAFYADPMNWEFLSHPYADGDETGSESYVVAEIDRGNRARAARAATEDDIAARRAPLTVKP